MLFDVWVFWSGQRVALPACTLLFGKGPQSYKTMSLCRVVCDLRMFNFAISPLTVATLHRISLELEIMYHHK